MATVVAPSLTRVPAQFDDQTAFFYGETYLQRLPVTKLGKVMFLPVLRVVWIGTQHRMVYAFTESQRHALDFSLDDLAGQLDPRIFFRVHRSSIVNLQHVRKIATLEDGRCKLMMNDKAGSEITVSRYRTVEFKKALRGEFVA